MSAGTSEADFRYFRSLLVCFGLSILLLAGAHLFVVETASGTRLLPMIVAAVPIAVYHLLILRPQARRGLSQAAIDSVYYFGFLVTVAALGVSAITISRSGDAVDVNAIVYQFGIGLFATGYAVFARLHLTSISRDVGATSPESALDAYVERSQGLIDNLDLAMSSFRSLAESASNAADDIKRLHESAVNNIEKIGEAALIASVDSMRHVSNAFLDDLKARTGESAALLEDARALFRDSAFKEEREVFCRSVKELALDASELRAAIHGSIRPAQEMSAGIERATNCFSGVGEAAASASVTLNAVWGSDGESVKSARAIADALSGLRVSVGEIGAANTALKLLSEQAAASASSHVRASRTLARIDKALASLEADSERLATVFAAVGERSSLAESGLRSVSVAVDSLSQIGPKLEVTGASLVKFGEAVGRASGGFERSVSESVDSLERGVRRTAEAGAALSENIVKIAEIVIEKTSAKQGLR